MEKLNITKVAGTNTKKDGTALLNKFGKPYYRVGIQTTQYPNEWINGFMPSMPEWEGKEVELDVTEEEYNGKMQKKFALPKKEDKVAEDIAKIKIELTNMMIILRDIQANTVPKYKPHYPSREEEGIADGVPFGDEDNHF